MSLLDSALDRIEKLIDRKIEASAPFRATVSSVSGGMATIKRLGTSTAETESRATINGAPLAVNDEVLCVPVNGKPVVIGVPRRSGHVEYGHSYRIPPQDTSGEYYATNNVVGGASSSDALTVDRLYATPFYVGPGGFAADRIATYVSTAAAGSARLGVYTMHATAFRPDALTLDAGTVDTSTTGFKEITISQTFTANPPYYMIWLALVANATPQLRAVVASTALLGTNTDVSGRWLAGLYQAHTYGALPASFSSSPTKMGVPPLLYLRKT